MPGKGGAGAISAQQRMAVNQLMYDHPLLGSIDQQQMHALAQLQMHQHHLLAQQNAAYRSDQQRHDTASYYGQLSHNQRRSFRHEVLRGNPLQNTVLQPKPHQPRKLRKSKLRRRVTIILYLAFVPRSLQKYFPLGGHLRN